jgi:thiol:disulfide interchange protein DsbC
MPHLPRYRAVAVLAGLLLAGSSVLAQEAAIRKALTERLPNLPRIDEISKTPIPGLFEVRFGGAEIIYTDAEGRFVVQGSLIDTKTMSNLTEERIEKLTAVAFSALPLKDAFVIKQGNGSRKLAVFGDPNCGFCKRFERDLATVKDVTIYSFLMPILGPDSMVKARDIWCSKDVPKTWRAWMIDGVVPAKASEKCDVAALERNVEFGRKHRINGTPALVFEDGTRKPGALPAKVVDELLTAAAKKS